MGQHHSHSHAGTPDANRGRQGRLLWALILTGGFALVEVVGGVVSGSLALIADAGHMATDSASLLLAWLAFQLARRPADDSRSYGFHRAEILAAFVNGLAMILLAAWIIYEAFTRLQQPVEVMGGMMLTVALVGLAVNIVAFFLLHNKS